MKFWSINGIASALPIYLSAKVCNVSHQNVSRVRLGPRSGGSSGRYLDGTDSFGSHPSDTPGYNPFELQSSTPLPSDTPLRSIRREIEHLLKVSRQDDAVASALGLFKTLTFRTVFVRVTLASLKFMIPRRKLLRSRPKCFYAGFNLWHSTLSHSSCAKRDFPLWRLI